MTDNPGDYGLIQELDAERQKRNENPARDLERWAELAELQEGGISHPRRHTKQHEVFFDRIYRIDKIVPVSAPGNPVHLVNPVEVLLRESSCGFVENLSFHLKLIFSWRVLLRRAIH